MGHGGSGCTRALPGGAVRVPLPPFLLFAIQVLEAFVSASSSSARGGVWESILWPPQSFSVFFFLWTTA
jgi:hypothetical protein